MANMLKAADALKLANKYKEELDLKQLDTIAALIYHAITKGSTAIMTEYVLSDITTSELITKGYSIHYTPMSNITKISWGNKLLG